MSKNRSACVSSTWTSADTTITTRASYFYGLVALGSADLSTVTLLDGTAIKFALSVATTANVTLALSYPIVLTSSLVIDITGTASYAIMYSTVLV